MRSAKSDSPGARNFRSACQPLQKNPIRTQRPVSRETKYLALHPDNPLLCYMTTQLPVVKTKISAFLQLFCDCGLLSPICKAEGDCSTTDLLRFWSAICAFTPCDNPQSQKSCKKAEIFVFRPLGQPQDEAIGEKPQEWQLGITLYSTRNRAVRTQRIFICAVLIAGDTLNQKGWTIHRPAF